MKSFTQGYSLNLGFPGSSADKKSACNAGDSSLIPGLGRSPREGIGYPLQYSWGFLVAQTVENPPACGRSGFDPTMGRPPGGWHDNTPQYSCLENPHRPKNLVGYSPECCKKSDMTERSTVLTKSTFNFLTTFFKKFYQVKSIIIIPNCIEECHLKLIYLLQIDHCF